MTMRKKILVTGHTGRVGSVIYRALQEEYDVLSLGSGRKGVDALDIQDAQKVNDFFHRYGPFHAVIHCAAVAHRPFGLFRRQECYRINVLGTGNVVNAAIRYKAQKFLFLSSVSVYGEGKGVTPDIPLSELAPRDAYGWSKLEAEKFCLSKRDEIKMYILRASPIYSRHDLDGIKSRVYVPGTLHCVAVLIRPDVPRFSVCHINTVVKAIRLCLREACSDGLYNVSDAHYYTHRELMEKVFEIEGKGITVPFSDALTQWIYRSACAVFPWFKLYISTMFKKVCGENIFPPSKELEVVSLNREVEYVL